MCSMFLPVSIPIARTTVVCPCWAWRALIVLFKPPTELTGSFGTEARPVSYWHIRVIRGAAPFLVAIGGKADIGQRKCWIARSRMTESGQNKGAIKK